MRFLCRWQHVIPSERREGPDALAALITQLEGFEAPAAAWEADILPARLDNYDFTWLDDLCLAGRAAWTRLTAPARVAARSAGPIRTTPVTLVPRRSLRLWNRAVPAPAEPRRSAPARASGRRAICRGTARVSTTRSSRRPGMLRTQVEDALAELVALGLVHSDSFAGLRALLTPSDRRKPLVGGQAAPPHGAFRHRGRRTLGARSAAAAASRGQRRRRRTEPEHEIVDHIADTLLRRYGVVFWRLLEREAAWLPPWRELLRVLRRLEARGEIRGGRFVAGISGEQFALPEAVDLLRETRRAPPSPAWISLSAADPLNLDRQHRSGSEGARGHQQSRAVSQRHRRWRRSSPARPSGSQELEPRERAEAESALVKRQTGSPLLAYLR